MRKKVFLIALLAVAGILPCFGQIVLGDKASPVSSPRRVALRQAPPPRPHRPLLPPRDPIYLPPREIDVRPVYLQKRGRTVRYEHRHETPHPSPNHKKYQQRFVPPTPTGRISVSSQTAQQKNSA